ncbi:hypothetical protein ACFSTE_00225 [Aquimarina hainanensis]|uniref:C2H2-type domain-containing protein n=1 Tax=Aquimarina hainanensis TaxID=1578017 RepID=A0ABW5N2Y4_9FLAO|nr:hypothetical protein [Aquimarina sp. TRL1]QKX04643.1 hypothetical protein HN014_06855 [Aquimarina sp. TRL1]
MKSPTPNSSFTVSKIYCSLFGHSYKLSKKVTHHIKEYTCAHCGEQVTTNSKGKLEIMTPKLKEINEAIAYVHAKKLKRAEG